MNDPIFDDLRPYLFSIAYRMLGTVMDAEDMVQETYLRWRVVDAESVDAPKAFLAAITTRLCIDFLRSARERRETYIGPWLPEPLLTGDAMSVSATTVLAESLTTAFLLMLERLGPTERAAFLLRDVFDFDYNEIADIIERSPAATRQIVSRARTRLSPERQARYHPSPAEQEKLLSHFFSAVQEGDVDGLVALLADDARVMTDSGGKVIAARRPILGPANVARFLLGISRLAPKDVVFRPAVLNGTWGAVFYSNGAPILALTADYTSDGRVNGMYIMRNPDKLTHLPPPPAS